MTTLAIKLQAAKTSPAWQLVLDKFPFGNGPVPSLPERKLDALKSVVERPQSNAHWTSSIQSRTAWLNSLANQHGKRLLVVELVNSSRLLLHLGRSSVLENVGIHADRNTGLPVIPGSAVKGLLSTWACWEEHFNEADGSFREFTITSTQRRDFRQTAPALASAIFGDDSEGGSTAAGAVNFLGAFPSKPPRLELDIVTPHTDANGRDRNPVPNPFLAIAAGTPWRFAFLATREKDATIHLAQVESWLTEALEQSGIGAKTAAGYGRFLAPQLWQDAALDEATKQQESEKAAKEIANRERIAELRAGDAGDYSPASFENAVIKRLNKPGEYSLLETEIKTLRNNPANAPWIFKLTEALRESKDARKKLRDKDWFPKEWLPQ
jgi:CRISPR-associated protein Cmr6